MYQRQDKKLGFVVSVTPSLFLVRRNPLRVLPYQGVLSVDKVVTWIRKECQYVKQ